MDRYHPRRGRQRVLITGGCGFIGHILVNSLLSRGHHIVVLDDLSTGRKDALPSHPAITFYKGSVLDKTAVQSAIGGCQLVMHLACLVGKQLVTACPEMAFRVSLEGLSHILEVGNEIPVVLFSSSAVYGLDPAYKCDETWDIPYEFPLSYDGGYRGYAVGKWEMERLANREAKKGRAIVIIRPFNVVGPG